MSLATYNQQGLWIPPPPPQDSDHTVVSELKSKNALIAACYEKGITDYLGTIDQHYTNTPFPAFTFNDRLALSKFTTVIQELKNEYANFPYEAHLIGGVLLEHLYKSGYIQYAFATLGIDLNQVTLEKTSSDATIKFIVFKNNAPTRVFEVNSIKIEVIETRLYPKVILNNTLSYNLVTLQPCFFGNGWQHLFNSFIKTKPLDAHYDLNVLLNTISPGLKASSNLIHLLGIVCFLKIHEPNQTQVTILKKNNVYAHHATSYVIKLNGTISAIFSFNFYEAIDLLETNVSTFLLIYNFFKPIELRKKEPSEVHKILGDSHDIEKIKTKIATLKEQNRYNLAVFNPVAILIEKIKNLKHPELQKVSNELLYLFDDQETLNLNTENTEIFQSYCNQLWNKIRENPFEGFKLFQKLFPQISREFLSNFPRETLLNALLEEKNRNKKCIQIYKFLISNKIIHENKNLEWQGLFFLKTAELYLTTGNIKLFHQWISKCIHLPEAKHVYFSYLSTSTIAKKEEFFHILNFLSNNDSNSLWVEFIRSLNERTNQSSFKQSPNLSSENHRITFVKIHSKIEKLDPSFVTDMIELITILHHTSFFVKEELEDLLDLFHEKYIFLLLNTKSAEISSIVLLTFDKMVGLYRLFKEHIKLAEFFGKYLRSHNYIDPILQMWIKRMFQNLDTQELCSCSLELTKHIARLPLSEANLTFLKQIFIILKLGQSKEKQDSHSLKLAIVGLINDVVLGCTRELKKEHPNISLCNQFLSFGETCRDYIKDYPFISLVDQDVQKLKQVVTTLTNK